MRNVDDDENCSLFLDLLWEIVDAFINRKTKRFCKFLNTLLDLKENLQDLNRRRKGWPWQIDDDALMKKLRVTIYSTAKELICPYPADGKITSLDVIVRDDFDPTGELQKVIEAYAAEMCDTESEASEDTSIEEEIDDCVVNENPPDQEKNW